MATFPIYELYIELENYEPKMWRKIQVMNDITMARFAYILMTLFELRKKYSYEFKKDELGVFLAKHPEYARRPERLNDLNREFKKKRYGITSKPNLYMYRKEEGYEKLEDATKMQIRDVLVNEKETIQFVYDPEINWKINVKLEKIFVDKKMFAKDLPNIMDGSGFGIIEEYNGPKKLEEFRNKLEMEKWKNTTNYKFYNHLDEGKKFYFDKFDIEDMNYRIKILPRSFQEQYEKNYYPSNRQYKIMKRSYRVYKKK